VGLSMEVTAGTSVSKTANSPERRQNVRVALYSKSVSRATLRLIALAQQVSCDMEAGEGVARWDLDHARSILIGDYLIGLTESVEANLTQAAMHLARARELWTADSFATSTSMRIASARGQGIPGKPSENDSNRRVEANGHVAGFFRASGSALDNVGGIVVGIVGLQAPIVQASWTHLKLSKALPTGPAPEGAGRDLQVAVVDAIRAALTTGPDGWSEWTVDLRHTLVHRASRLAMYILDPRQPDGFLRPLPLHPAQTQAESMARTGKLGLDVVPEHGADTMDTILNCLIEVVSDTAASCVSAWQARRESPDLILQPLQQWPRLAQGRESTFGGARPVKLPKMAQGTMMMNPTTLARMKAAQLLDSNRSTWKEWFATDLNQNP
jgi:hypothetical protein